MSFALYRIFLNQSMVVDLMYELILYVLYKFQVTSINALLILGSMILSTVSSEYIAPGPRYTCPER